jgi:parallel beta-helix repeat protein
MRRDDLAVLFLVALGATAAADEIRVPQDQPTIQAAIDAAVANDVVIVSKGFYDENVTIEGRSDLTIQGKGAVVIRSTGTGLFIHASHNIDVTGIAVKGGTNGIDVFESDDVTIEKFAVSGVTVEGVSANDSTGVRLLNGRISDCGSDGVRFGEFEPVNSVEITGLKVKHCGSDGMQLHGQDIVVSHCKVADVEDDGFESEAGAGPVRFEDCKVSHAGSDGFLLIAPGSAAVDCVAKSCDDDAFDVEGAGSHLENCQAKGSDSRGFGLDEVDGVEVLSCKAIGNGDEGFELVEATNCRVESCVAKKSGDAGFSLTGISSGNTLTGNKASKSGTFDLSDSSEGTNTFTDNHFATVNPN